MSTSSDQLGLETVTCAGVIERVTYYDRASGWAVLAVALDDQRRTKLVGPCALAPAQGLRISATGRWETSRALRRAVPRGLGQCARSD